MRVPVSIVCASFLVVACTCGKKPDDGSQTASAASATVAPAAVESNTGAAAADTPPAQGAATPPAAGSAAGPVGGGKTVAANDFGKVQVNDAGSVTAKRADGDSVTMGPGGVTKANGVVVDQKKGTVSVPGVGNFKTPPP